MHDTLKSEPEKFETFDEWKEEFYNSMEKFIDENARLSRIKLTHDEVEDVLYINNIVLSTLGNKIIELYAKISEMENES